MTNINLDANIILNNLFFKDLRAESSELELELERDEDCLKVLREVGIKVS